VDLAFPCVRFCGFDRHISVHRQNARTNCVHRAWELANYAVTPEANSLRRHEFLRVSLLLFASCACHEDAVERNASQHCASNNQSGMSATDPQRASGWVDDHGECLYRYALLRVRKPEVAEDLVQETFLAAVRGYEKFGGRHGISFR